MQCLLTLEQIQELQKTALNSLVAYAGNAQHLSRMLALPESTVRGWIERGRISKSGAKQVGKHPTLGKHFTENELRPDLPSK